MYLDWKLAKRFAQSQSFGDPEFHEQNSRKSWLTFSKHQQRTHNTIRFDGAPRRERKADNLHQLWYSCPRMGDSVYVPVVYRPGISSSTPCILLCWLELHLIHSWIQFIYSWRMLTTRMQFNCWILLIFGLFQLAIPMATSTRGLRYKPTSHNQILSRNHFKLENGLDLK